MRVPTSRVDSGRGRWRATGLAAAGILLIAVGFAARSGPSAPTTAPAEAISSHAASPPAQRPVAAAALTSPQLAVGSGRSGIAPPRQVTCHGFDASWCRRVVDAAVAVVPSTVPTPSWAAVWPSLFCQTSLDCPPDYLVGDAVPLGTVVLAFDSRDRPIIVNVIGRPKGDRSGLTAADLVAWVAAG